MRNFRWVVVIILIATETSGQQPYSLERSVVSCFGMDSTADSLRIQMTAGQAEYYTSYTDDMIFTQGFQQPIIAVVPGVVVEFIFDECTGHLVASITDITGCTDPDSAIIYWNNIAGQDSILVVTDSLELDIYGPVGCHMENVYVISTANIVAVPCEYDFYQLITPNNDGLNDGWFIDQLGLPGFESANVIIINRWGTEVWSGENYDNHNVLWTGLSNSGSVLPDGTYFYIVETNTRSFSGFVELQR